MANFLVSLCVIIFRSYSFSLLTTKLRWNFLECQCSRIDAFGGEALRWIYLVKYLKSLRIIDLWLPLKKNFHTLACFIAISTRMISCFLRVCYLRIFCDWWAWEWSYCGVSVFSLFASVALCLSVLPGSNQVENKINLESHHWL